MAKGRKKSKKTTFIVILLLFVVAVVVAVVALSGGQEEIIKVQTQPVMKRTITQVVSATGKINPIDQVVITPEVTGEIVELPVEEGDLVKKGELLIRIKPDIYVAQKNRSKASLESAKASLKVRKANLDQMAAEYERLKGLYEKGLASDAQLESAKASYLTAQGNVEAQQASILQAEESLKEAEENLSRTAIYAPLDGTISVLNVELGERVLGSGFSQGTNIMTVADLNTMEAIVDVDENDVVLVEVGDTARIEIDAFRDTLFDGVVYQISNSASTTGLGTQEEVVEFEVKIRLLDYNDKIKPGMSCDADIETETRKDVWSVPIQSVTARMPQMNRGANPGGEKGAGAEGGNSFAMQSFGQNQIEPEEVVFSVDGDMALMNKVTTGISDDAFIEVISGLNGDQKIITGPYRAISKQLSDSTVVVVEGARRPGAAKKQDESNEN